MKRFLLGTLTGVLIVAVVVTIMPDRAHVLIDQAGQVRGMLEDVAARLERLEDRKVNTTDSVTVSLPQPATPAPLVFEAPIESRGITTAPVKERASEQGDINTASVPESVQRQAVDFDNLADGLSRVSGALERLNRTMKPGNSSSRKPAESTSSDADSTS